MWYSTPLRSASTNAWPWRALPLVLMYLPSRGPDTRSAYACPLTGSIFSPLRSSISLACASADPKAARSAGCALMRAAAVAPGWDGKTFIGPPVIGIEGACLSGSARQHEPRAGVRAPAVAGPPPHHKRDGGACARARKLRPQARERSAAAHAPHARDLLGPSAGGDP